MGRIDEAMNRARMDAGQGTGAVAPVPSPSPWEIEPTAARDHAAPPAQEAPRTSPPSRPETGGQAQRRAPRPVSKRDGPWPDRLVVSPAARPLMVEQFRRLAATMARAKTERDLKSVLVTSPEPGDGKSNVATNLALTLSESYHHRVLLIDADLRRPTLHSLFGVQNTAGLAEALQPGNNGEVSTVEVTDTLALLPAGRPEISPVGGLASDRLKHLIADAAARFDWIIVDSPPVGMLADAHLLSEAVDATILVIRAGVTPYPELESATAALGHERILGVVLNAVEPDQVRGEGYYSHYYGSERA